MGVASKLIRDARTTERPKFNDYVKECRAQKKFSNAQFHIREAAEAAFGPAWATRLQQASRERAWVREAATGATDVTVFRDVIGAMTIATIEDGYQEAMSGIADMFTVWGTPDAPTGTKDIYERSSATGTPMPVAPGTEYPRTGFQGLKITAPEPIKYGLIGALTLETVKENDSKGFLKDQLDVGRNVADYQRDLMIRLFLGLTNNYTQNGTTYNTYVTSGGLWVNNLDDWDITTGPAALDRADELFLDMKHPVTGRSINVKPNAAFAIGAAYFQVRSLLNATEIRVTNGSTQTVGQNPYTGSFDAMKDPEAKRIMLAESGLSSAVVNTHVYYGDFKEAFYWREVEPFSVFETDENTDAGFFQDIVYAVKARFWGCPFVRNPRYVARLRKTS